MLRLDERFGDSEAEADALAIVGESVENMPTDPRVDSRASVGNSDLDRVVT